MWIIFCRDMCVAKNTLRGESVFSPIYGRKSAGRSDFHICQKRAVPFFDKLRDRREAPVSVSHARIFVILQKIHTCLLTILTKMVECSLANIPDNFIPYQEWRRERPNEATATCFSRCQIRRESKDEERARKFSTLSVQAGRFFVAHFRELKGDQDYGKASVYFRIRYRGTSR